MSARLSAFLSAADPEAEFLAQFSRLISARRERKKRVASASAQPSLLLLGYNGVNNIGADARVCEILRQLRAMFGDSVRLSIAMMGEAVPQDLFASADFIPLSTYAVDQLEALSESYDGLLVVEGGAFKSEHADFVGGLFAGALGLWDAGGQLAVGYGSDAGVMSPRLSALVAELGAGPQIYCRTERARARLSVLGLSAHAGADTAWSFQAAPASDGQALLAALNLRAGRPLLVVCPINPFWWPLHADPARAAAMSEADAEFNYGSVFFHADDPARRAAYAAYLDALAFAIEDWRARTGGETLLVGMERIDRRAVDNLSARLSFEAPRLTSGDAPHRAVVALLRAADLIVTSRYHALVLSGPAGIPVVGVSMDSRIVDLLEEAGMGGGALATADPRLKDALPAAMARAEAEHAQGAASMKREVVQQLLAMATMGRAVAHLLRLSFPGLKGPDPNAPDEQFLPPLDASLAAALAAAAPQRRAP